MLQTLKALARPSHLAIFAVCAALSTYNFLLFHTVVEFVAITIAVMMCVAAWNTAGFARDNLLLYLGNGFFWVAVLDAVHTLIYKGMHVFAVDSANAATQLWLAARYLQALVLVTAPLVAGWSLSRGGTFLGVGAVTAAVGWSIYAGIFPAAFVEGHGLTPFKVYSEYVIIGLLLVALVLLWRNRRRLEEGLLWPMTVAIILTVASEFAFTLYIQVYGLSNVIGHLCKLSAFYLLFVAVVEQGFALPFRQLRREIDTRRRAEQTLSQERGRLDEIIRGTNVGTWEWNVQTGETRFNQRWAEIVGYSLADLQPVSFDTWVELCHPDDLQRSNELVRKNFSGELPYYDCEVRMRHKDGGWVWVHDRGTVVEWTDDGRPLRMAGTHTDITQRKEAERQLAEAKETAVNANRSKSDFLASMSHELRTPLNAILGFGQMLQLDLENHLTDKQREYITHILAGGHNLLELVNDILDLTRIEANRLSISLEAVDPAEVVVDSIVQVQPLSAAKGVTIADRLDGGDFPLVRTDHTRFRQVLLNLLSNAIKYNETPGHVSVEGQVADGFLRVSVSDTGIGIPAAKQSRVFQLFERLNADPKIAGEGTGIGLAVSKMLVERLGGRIGFASEVGRGSTFWIELPLASNDEVMIWTDDYRIGVEALDRDHQNIFALANRLSRYGTMESELPSVIKQVIDYTRYHFRREEAIMEVCGFPDLDLHRQDHRTLQREVDTLADDWRRTSDPQLLQKLRSLLRHWWRRHIVEVDSSITPYVAGHEAAIREALDRIDVDDMTTTARPF